MAEVSIISLLTTTVEYLPFQIIIFFFSVFTFAFTNSANTVKLWLVHRAEHCWLPSCKFACIPDFTRHIILLYCINLIRWLFYCSNVTILFFDVNTYLQEAKDTDTQILSVASAMCWSRCLYEWQHHNRTPFFSLCRLQKSVMPTIPDPKYIFTDLFNDHSGNFQVNISFLANKSMNFAMLWVIWKQLPTHVLGWCCFRCPLTQEKSPSPYAASTDQHCNTALVLHKRSCYRKWEKNFRRKFKDVQRHNIWGDARVAFAYIPSNDSFNPYWSFNPQYYTA